MWWWSGQRSCDERTVVPPEFVVGDGGWEVGVVGCDNPCVNPWAIAAASTSTRPANVLL